MFTVCSHHHHLIIVYFDLHIENENIPYYTLFDTLCVSVPSSFQDYITLPVSIFNNGAGMANW